MSAKLCIVPMGGLCNRLRLVLSIVEISSRWPNLRFEIDWSKHPECYAWFEELFEPLHLPAITIHHQRWWTALHRRRNGWWPGLVRLAMGYTFQRGEYLPKDETALSKVLSRHHRLYIASGFSLCDYSAASIAHLRPVPALQERINEIVSRFAPHTIGIHIRRTDNTVSQQHSRLQDFHAAIQREIAQDEQVRFFLCTDDAAVKAEFCQKYGHRILTQTSPVARDTLAGMQDAVVDLWCLAHTQKILGSYWSSFTDMAAELRQIPLEVVQGPGGRCAT